MASTFGLLSTAASGLRAARAGMDVVGQNIANLNTSGYTRQRVETSALAPLRGANQLDTAFRVGSGVSIDSVSRLSNTLLENRVQTTMSESGQSYLTTTVYATLEAAIAEPSDNGLSASLSDFWSAWQNVSSQPTDDSIRGVLLQEAQSLVTRISQTATAVESTWSNVRSDLVDSISEVNGLAVRFADLNKQITTLAAAGGSTNELLDEQARLGAELAGLTGSTLRRHPDGSADVILGGNALVTADTARRLVVTGTLIPGTVGSDPVTVEWEHHAGVAVEIGGGEVAGRLDALSATGPLRSQLDALDAVATSLATKVNALHQTGATRAGVTNLGFFSFATGVPAAHGLTVVPASVDAIAAATPSTGGAGGQVADSIADLRDAADGPDALWNKYVVALGTASRAATSRSTLADQAAAGAVANLQSEAGVDIDEETISLMTYQHAYQGAARVMTAVDEMLDTLINRMGLVGR
jgi:flagellar hook-associated protein 1 FlgK